MMDGILLVDKPEGMTSADVVRVVKQRFRCKTGHLGTLDPFATGLLPLCIGEGTKIAQFLNLADKEYVGRIRLGSATDSGDLTGTVTATAPVPSPNAAELARVAAQFRGAQLQTPPMYSAIKHQGTPLYKLARQGLDVEREPREVRIDALSLTDHGDGAIEFSVACSKGTYIRVLAEHIAVALGSVGHLEQLRRTRFGHFRVEEAIALAALGRAVPSVIGLREALRHLPEIPLDASAAQRARQGYQPLLVSIPCGGSNTAAKLIGPDQELAAVIVADRVGRWGYARVFADGGRTAS
jgi:tRNA pseudouridine55 synthase